MNKLDELYEKKKNLNNQIEDIEKEIEEEKEKERIKKAERSIAFRDNINNNNELHEWLIKNSEVYNETNENFNLVDWLDSYYYDYLAREYEMTIEVHFNKI